MNKFTRLLSAAVVAAAVFSIGSMVVFADDSKVGVVIAQDGLNLRAEPSTDATVVEAVPKGEKVTISDAQEGWYKVSHGKYQGFMSSNYVSVDEKDIANANDSAESSDEAQKLIAYAKKYLGVRYQYGGSTPSGFDCSGFTSYVFKNSGYSLQRTAASQATQGTYVSKGDLAPGDLVFFSGGGQSIGHVGIYVGDGNMIHSPSPGKTVEITTINSGYYSKYFKTARKIIG